MNIQLHSEAAVTSRKPNTHQGPHCRFCASTRTLSFVDLGMSPLCQSSVLAEQLNSMEAFYPLHAFICKDCLLVQLEEYVSASDIFSEYAYFSSYSDSWVEHGRRYTQQMIQRFGIDGNTRVVEVASNDGYLLQHFAREGIPVLGIEPAANVAKVAIEKGIPTDVRFFGHQCAETVKNQRGPADLLIGNNVLAHVPDLNDFVDGLQALLSPQGIITMEFPHLARLMHDCQFDTIYHEHFCYFSLLAVERIFAAHQLRLFDVEEIVTHGGSLRIFACQAGNAERSESDRLQRLRQWERENGFHDLNTYLGFEDVVRETKWKLLTFLIAAKRAGQSIVGYGAPGKGNTLLNYCGIRTDFLDYTVDRSPYKQGKYTPGTHIPILHPDKIRETQPHLVLILPWNLQEEIVGQLDYVRAWGGRFVIPIPEARVLA